MLLIASVRAGTLRNHLNDHLAIELEPFPVGTTLPVVNPHHAQLGKLRTRRIHHEASTFAVIDIGRMYDNLQHQPIGIHEQMPLTPLNLLVPIQAAEPPFSVVLTD